MQGDKHSETLPTPIKANADHVGVGFEDLLRRHLSAIVEHLDARLAQHHKEIKETLLHRQSSRAPASPKGAHCDRSVGGDVTVSGGSRSQSLSPRGGVSKVNSGGLFERSRSPCPSLSKAPSQIVLTPHFLDKVSPRSTRCNSRPASRSIRPASRGPPDRSASRESGLVDSGIISFALPGGTLEEELSTHTALSTTPRTQPPPDTPPETSDEDSKEGQPHFSKGQLRHRSVVGFKRRMSQDMWRQKIHNRLVRKALVVPQTIRPADYLTAQSKMEAEARQNFLAGIVFSEYFDLVTSFFIIANCIFIVVQLEVVTAEAAAHGDEVIPSWHLPVECFFCVIFGIEFTLRWVVHGRNIFRSQDWQWTIFDGSVVVVSVVELLLDALADSSRLGNTSFFRSMRTLRTTRAIRVVRVFRFFKELRMLIHQILGSFKTLVWSAVMMVLFWYVCGVTLTTATYEACVFNETPLHEDCDALKDRFGTLRRAVLALYMSMAGGVDWDVIYQAMDPLSEAYRALFLVYLFFTMFGVLNIVTGIFVESAKEAGNSDRDGLVRTQMRYQDKYMLDMIRVFQEIDSNGSGRISRYEFELYLRDERALAYFEAMKLDISDVSTLFDLLDVNRSGGIDIEEFLSGCQRLRGESRALDLAVLRTEILSWMGHFSIFAEKVEKQLEAMNTDRSGPQSTGGHTERRAWPSNNPGL